MDLALWTIAIGLAVVFAGKRTDETVCTQRQARHVWPGLGAGLQPHQYPIDRTRRNPRRRRASLAGRSAYRPDIGTAGCSRARTGDGGCGRCSLPATKKPMISRSTRC